MICNVNTENTENLVVKKRGRKSKKDILEIETKTEETVELKISNETLKEESNENNVQQELDVPSPVKKQTRTRKTKKEKQEEMEKQLEEKDLHSVLEVQTITKVQTDTEVKEAFCEHSNDENVENPTMETVDFGDEDKKSIIKKRGRKPKGGKIIQQIVPNNNVKENKPNIILHLKCSSKDLINNISGSNYDVESFAFNSTNLNYEVIQQKTAVPEVETNNTTHDVVVDSDNSFKMKDVWNKLKELEYNLHINNISDKRSACFWCTYDFDNPPIYIPKHFIKETYHVYGCFCSPECSVAYLMNENIDSSAKFERYHFINHIYAKIFNYTKNIKPAPNPYYMLEKYYGNLNIQEYRSLLRNERLFLIVDKPLTRILPELHEDNDEFILNNKMIPSNTYQIKKKNQKKTLVKNNIVNEQFGLV